ncbi:MAG: hypothetical protein JW876_00665 [Candidatus Krumholzibacteriota bacterium]|nr:hypothetical protein [Candidatus Krumholzibacteriota bacterium]
MARVPMFLLLLFVLPVAAAAQVYIDSPSTPGEIWPSGLPGEIKWRLIGTPDAVKIEVSYDAKQSWNLLVDCYPDVGHWTWAIPSGIESQQCYLRIHSKYLATCFYDYISTTTDFSFIITVPPQVTVRPIDIDEISSGECFDVTIDIVNRGGFEMNLWFDVDMYDASLVIFSDEENDMPFVLPPFGSMTVTRPFCIPYGHRSGDWNVKVMLWGVREEDGDYNGPRLFDSGWIHPMAVAVERATWGGIKSEGR